MFIGTCQKYFLIIIPLGTHWYIQRVEDISASEDHRGHLDTVIPTTTSSGTTSSPRALHNELHSCSGTTTSTFDARRIIFYVLYIGTYANWRVYLCSWAEEIYNSNSLTWLRHFTRIHNCYDIITGYLYNRSWRIIIRVICHDNKILHRRIPPLHTSRLVWTRNAYIIVIISYTPIYVTTEGIL